MSNVSGGSTGSSSGCRVRVRVTGVPKVCWCGEPIVNLLSKSVPNPYRRYFRCQFAASERLDNDKHVFKWVDEALINEVETLQIKNARLEEELKEIATERKDFDKFQMKLEKEIFQRVEGVLEESSSRMKKMMIFVVFGCLIIVGGSKILG